MASVIPFENLANEFNNIELVRNIVVIGAPPKLPLPELNPIILSHPLKKENSSRCELLSSDLSIQYYNFTNPEDKNNYKIVALFPHNSERYLSQVLPLVEGALIYVQNIFQLHELIPVIQELSLAKKHLVLVIDGVDRYFDLKISFEEIYQQLLQVVTVINQELPVNLVDTISPVKCNIVFTCGDLAFSLESFAELYAQKFQHVKDVKQFSQKLWGNYFLVDDKFQHFETVSDDKLQQHRTFCKLVLQPICDIYNSCMNNDYEKIEQICKNLKIEFNKQMYVHLQKPQRGNNLLRECFGEKSLSFNYSTRIFAALVKSIPNARQYHSSLKADESAIMLQYIASAEDDEIGKAIAKCDSQAPLIAKTCATVYLDKHSTFSLAKVLSGTLVKQYEYRIASIEESTTVHLAIEAACIPGKQHLFGTICEAQQQEEFPNDSVSAGNIVLIKCSQDQVHFFSNSFIQDVAKIPEIKIQKQNFKPLAAEKPFTIAVEPISPADLPHMIAVLKQIASNNVETAVLNTGEYVIKHRSYSQLQRIAQSINERVPIKTSEIQIGYREVVTAQSPVVMTKTPNKHSRLFISAEPLEEPLLKKFMSGELSHTMDIKLKERLLWKEFKWAQKDIKRLWAIGENCNLFVDKVKDEPYLHEIKGSVVASFQWVEKEGVLCNAPLYGVQFQIIDANFHADSTHRGAGQIIPTGLWF